MLWEADIPFEQLEGIPVMVVSGAWSPAFDAVCDVIEDRLGARREVLAGYGHSIPDLGDPVNALLRDFWASTEVR